MAAVAAAASHAVNGTGAAGDSASPAGSNGVTLRHEDDAAAEDDEEDWEDEEEDEEEEEDESSEATGLRHLESCIESLEGARAGLQAAADQLLAYAQVRGGGVGEEEGEGERRGRWGRGGGGEWRRGRVGVGLQAAAVQLMACALVRGRGGGRGGVRGHGRGGAGWRRKSLCSARQCLRLLWHTALLLLMQMMMVVVVAVLDGNDHGDGKDSPAPSPHRPSKANTYRCTPPNAATRVQCGGLRRGVVPPGGGGAAYALPKSEEQRGPAGSRRGSCSTPGAVL